MNWKNEYQLLDMDTGDVIGFTCKECGLYQPKTVEELRTRFENTQYLQEIEQKLICKSWGCNSSLRMEVSHSNLMEGFQGGLA